MACQMLDTAGGIGSVAVGVEPAAVLLLHAFVRQLDTGAPTSVALGWIGATRSRQALEKFCAQRRLFLPPFDWGMRQPTCCSILGGSRGRVPCSLPTWTSCVLVHYAVLAPSNHSTQPWKFRVHDAVLGTGGPRAGPAAGVIRGSRAGHQPRRGPLPPARGSRRFGRHLLVDTFPDPDDRDLVARAAGGGGPRRRRAPPLRRHPRRHTSRFPFDDRGLAARFEDLRRAVVAEGPGSARSRTKRRIACRSWPRATAACSAMHFRHELAVGAPNHRRTATGVPGYAQGVGDVASLFGPFVVHNFDLGRVQSARDRALSRRRCCWCLGRADEPTDWLTTGRALARLLLTATRAAVVPEPTRRAGRPARRLARPWAARRASWSCGWATDVTHVQPRAAT
jgi:hypothetical protein